MGPQRHRSGARFRSCPAGETVSITLNGVTQQAPVDAAGNFSSSFDTHALAVAGSPYTITYAYAGDANLDPLTDVSKTLTVTTATPAFSDLQGPTIAYGTATTTLGGTISPVPAGETVSITLNGVTQQAVIAASGSFSISFDTHAAAVSGSPYTITYAYAGDANLNPLTDASKTLTVTMATPAFSDLLGPTIAYGTAATTLGGTILDGATPPTGDVSITVNGVTQQAAIGADGSFSSSFDTHALAISGSPYAITYTYAGDADSNPGTDVSKTLTVTTATPTLTNLLGPTITFGTAATTLGGTILDGATPPTGDVSITVNGVTQQAAIGPNGSFSSSFDTQALTVANSPYAITYAYAGDPNSNPVTDTSKSLTVVKPTPAFSDLLGPTITYATATTTLGGTISLDRRGRRCDHG